MVNPSEFNELEWVNGEIWANVWQTDSIARIDPETGTVTGMIDLTGLLAEEDRLRDTDVLNGIVVDPVTGSIWVTGKRWPWLYEIALEKPCPDPWINSSSIHNERTLFAPRMHLMQHDHEGHQNHQDFDNDNDSIGIHNMNEPLAPPSLESIPIPSP